MDRAELRERLAQKFRQRADARRPPDFRKFPAGPSRPGAWPTLPSRDNIPEILSEALRHDTADILAGRWRAFGHVLMYVNDPPNWFMDHAARRDVTTTRHGFRANHRSLPDGCDIKLVWELSRWHSLVRLAQSAWIAGDATAAAKMLQWFEHWRRQNPPYIGWNWTSALESGLRLLNLSWIDALLAGTTIDWDRAAWDRLRERLLAPHVWFTWRHRSYGSSANNHLLGELAGLIAAITRWPALEHWGPKLDELHALWEREVLAQFAPDGGNREQALNYQLFSWELCWHSRNALLAAGRSISPDVEERLRRAADFFVAIQSPTDPWDYGDSDSALAVPLFADDTRAGHEWLEWLADPTGSPSLRWWLGEPPAPMEPTAWVRPAPADQWMVFPDTGQAVSWSGRWLARWDLSPLGYLSTAAHGHLDALHVSLWLGGVALVVDPGTGAYYGDVRLRTWLASWLAHNGPHVPGVEFPTRLGPFLWENHHAQPTWRPLDERTLAAELAMPHGKSSRQIRRLLGDGRDGWRIEDHFEHGPESDAQEFRVCWQFAPGTRLSPIPDHPRTYRGWRRAVGFTMVIDPGWTGLTLVSETPVSSRLPVVGDLAGVCSPEFRQIEAGPLLVLTANRSVRGPLQTTFLAEPE